VQPPSEWWCSQPAVLRVDLPSSRLLAHEMLCADSVCSGMRGGLHTYTHTWMSGLDYSIIYLSPYLLHKYTLWLAEILDGDWLRAVPRFLVLALAFKLFSHVHADAGCYRLLSALPLHILH
jgi:hypothetical protein